MWSFLLVLVAKGTTMFGLPRWTSRDGDSSPTSFRHRYGADNESAPGRITREGEAAQGLTPVSVPMMRTTISADAKIGHGLRVHTGEIGSHMSPQTDPSKLQSAVARGDQQSAWQLLAAGPTRTA